jgi:hypothetical protein
MTTTHDEVNFGTYVTEICPGGYLWSPGRASHGDAPSPLTIVGQHAVRGRMARVVDLAMVE